MAEQRNVTDFNGAAEPHKAPNPYQPIPFADRLSQPSAKPKKPLASAVPLKTGERYGYVDQPLMRPTKALPPIARHSEQGGWLAVAKEEHAPALPAYLQSRPLLPAAEARAYAPSGEYAPKNPVEKRERRFYRDAEPPPAMPDWNASLGSEAPYAASPMQETDDLHKSALMATTAWDWDAPEMTARRPPLGALPENPMLRDEIAAFFDEPAPLEPLAWDANEMPKQQSDAPFYTEYRPALYTPSAQPAQSTGYAPSASAAQAAWYAQPASGAQPTPARATEERPPLGEGTLPTQQKAQPLLAHEKQMAAKKKASDSRPPIRLWRVLALLAAAGMLLFCTIVGGQILWRMADNEQDMKKMREEYLAREGISLEADASRVELLPPGQTFVPTNTPEVTRALETPSPTPVFAMNEAAIQSLDKRDKSNIQEAQTPSPTPAPRTRYTAYADNSLHIITEGIAGLHEEYPDVVGRLVIGGVLDEPVTRRNNTFYLTHDYRGRTSDAGAVFMDESCTLEHPPENLLLRGQSAVAGKTFAPLWQFVSGGRDFVASATTAHLTTLYEEASYVLFAVINADSDPQGAHYFNYASQPTFTTDEAMMRYVQNAQSRSLYPFGVEVQPSDRLLTLATLGNGNDATCLVLLYRMLRPGEGIR
ncbi:MAG: hypothetical protein RR521_07605 [Clostridia bacterium]